MNKVAVKTSRNSKLTNEMYEWLLKHGLKENDSIDYHNPLLIQCIEELQPIEWWIREINSDKYAVIETLNDFIIVTPEEIESIEWTIIQ